MGGTVVDVHPCEPRLERRHLVRREPARRAEGVIPVAVTRAGIPCPGAAGGRLQREPEPRLLFPERRFGARPFDGVPGPFADLANQFDLPRGPDARRVVSGAEHGNGLPVFEQRHADHGRNLSRPERRPLFVAEPLIRPHVADHDGLAARERLAHLRAHEDSPKRAAGGVVVARVLAADDELAVAKLGVGDAGDAELLAQMPGRRVLDGGGIAQGAERVVQPQKKRQPLLVPPQFGFRLAVLERRPDPIGRHFNQGDLISRPDPRRGAVDAERPEPSAVLDQRRADERRGVTGQQLLALRGREPRIRTDVVDRHRLAAAAGVDDGRAESGERASTGRGRDAVGIGPADDERVAIDVRIVDAAGVEMFPEQADRDVLDRDRVLQRSQLLVERDQEIPLGSHGLILVAARETR